MRDPVLLDICPESDDPAHLRAHGIAALAKLARVCSDPIVAMHAAIWLIEYADAMELARAEVKAQSVKDKQDEIIRNLKNLYTKAIGPAAAPLVVSETVETALEPASAIAEDSSHPDSLPAAENRT